MIRALTTILILLLAAALATGCRDEQKMDWQKTVAADTPEAYRAYIAKHPSGLQTDMAKYYLQQMSYRRAVHEQSLEAFNAYLAEYPNGNWAVNARAQRDAIISRLIEKIDDQTIAAARIRFETTNGPFTVRVFVDQAPRTSRNFIALVAAGFYNGLDFYHIEPKLMVQTGDPRGDGLGGPGYFIPFEQNGLKHSRGKVAMWHTPVDQSTAGSQFYICLTDLPDRDGKFSVFGEVLDGMTMLDEISQAATRGAESLPNRPVAPVKIVRTVTEGITLK